MGRAIEVIKTTGMLIGSVIAGIMLYLVWYWLSGGIFV